MHRSLLPIILASLGFVLIVMATSVLPLFEWQISETTIDFPPSHEIHILPAPWSAKLGDSFDDGSFIFRKVFVSKDGRNCLKENLNFVVRRSPNDEALERVSLNVGKSISWLFGWGLIEIVLSGIYLWWFTIWYQHRPVFHAIVYTVIAAIFFLFLTQVLRLAGPLFSPYYFGVADCFSGTVTFAARLSKVHYEMPVVLLAGIWVELGAIGIIWRQITIAVADRKRTAN